MKASSIVRHWIVAATAGLGLAVAGNALAAGPGGGGHAGGGGGGFHGGGGGRAVGGGYHGGGYGGYRGGYHGHGYYGGWHGYYGGYGWRGGWGWGCCGFGLGWYLPVLPFGYTTWWWGGVPYYYADNSYYVWDRDAGQYQAVEPPAGLTSTPNPGSTTSGGAPPAGTVPGQWTDLYAYPKGGQSTEEQTRDRDECHKWAVAQTGYDPAQPGNGQDAAAKRAGYLRAEGACLEGRNYSVK